MTSRETLPDRSIDSLEGKIIELTVHFPAGGHVDVTGRVHVIDPVVWVGPCCVPCGTIVKRLGHRQPGAWTIYSDCWPKA